MKNRGIGLYLRLSDEDGCEFRESNSITSQREILKNYVRSHREFADYHTAEFCDDGYSGTNFARPGVQKLLEQVRAGVISVIMVKDFSRFGRNYIEVGNYLEQVFPFLGIRFISVNDGFDSGVWSIFSRGCNLHGKGDFSGLGSAGGLCLLFSGGAAPGDIGRCSAEDGGRWDGDRL